VFAYVLNKKSLYYIITKLSSWLLISASLLLMSVAGLDLELRGLGGRGGTVALLALPAFLPSVISSF